MIQNEGERSGREHEGENEKDNGGKLEAKEKKEELAKYGEVEMRKRGVKGKENEEEEEREFRGRR